MKIAILSCMWKREDIFRIFAQSMQRFKAKGILPLIIGSEGGKSESLVKEYDLAYIEYPNNPLGAKFNTGMRVLRGVDYVMVLGSDDIISDSYMDLFIEGMKQGYDLIGTLDAYYYSPQNNELGYWKGYEVKHRKGETIGMGRTLSKKLLNQVRWQPWRSDLNRGLDGSMMSKIKRLKPRQLKIKMADSGIFGIDIKTSQNITPYSCFKTLEKRPIDDIKILPEWKQILSL